MGASICCAEADTGTQFTIFDLSALKKQLLIFMSLKLKVVLILICVFVGYGIVDFGIQRFIIFPSFLSLEREESIKNVKRSVQAIQREIHHLDYLCWDWAAWDDTYEFIKSQSDEYINANLVLATFVDAKLNTIYFVDTTGKIIWGESHDLETKKIIHLTEFPKDTFPADHPLISYKSENKSLIDMKVAGVYMTRKGPMLISSRPILTSSNEGPVRGSVILGRFLTDEIIKTLVDQTQTNFQFFPIMAGSLPEPLKDIPTRITDTSPYLVETGSNGHVDSYTTFPDIKGDAAFLIKSKTPRKISEKGYATMRYAMYSILGAGLGVLIVMLLLLHFSVLGPVTDFINHVMSIGKTGDLSANLSIQRRDEIGILASEFNRMLEQLKKFKAGLELMVNERTAELTITNEKLRQEIEERKKAEAAVRESEEKLARSKRMESLGLMAGGIAHDLNNILSGIVSYPDLLLIDLPEDSPLRKPIETIKESGHRATEVVSDLLTVVRGVAIGKEVLNLNTLVEEYLDSAEQKKLGKAYPAVTLKTHFDPELLNIIGSSTHVKKSLMNLITNAYESIEGSGVVKISIENNYLVTERKPPSLTFASGRCAKL
jgi:sensor domain CHASE-containing protein